MTGVLIGNKISYVKARRGRAISHERGMVDMLLQVLILREVDLLHDLLTAFTNAGVQGSTVLDCDGALQVLGQASDDAPPIFASLRKFMNPDQEHNKLVLTVLSEEQYPKARKAVADVVGDITAPGTGIIFTVPITNVEGLAKRKNG